MGTITGRHVAITDVTVLSIDTVSVLALFRNANFEITTEEIDVTAAQDTYKKREEGVKDWRMTCTNLVLASPKYLASIVSGGVILVSFVSTGFNFLGTGMMTGASLAIDNPFTEETTVLSAGNAPTMTFV